MDGHCGDPKAGDGFYYVQMKKHGGGMNCMSLQSLTDLWKPRDDFCFWWYVNTTPSLLVLLHFVGCIFNHYCLAYSKGLILLLKKCFPVCFFREDCRMLLLGIPLRGFHSWAKARVHPELVASSLQCQLHIRSNSRVQYPYRKSLYLIFLYRREHAWRHILWTIAEKPTWVVHNEMHSPALKQLKQIN